MQQQTTRETRPWVLTITCVLALASTWLAYFTVYDVLPAGTVVAHWGLFTLALASTAGLLVTLEHVVPHLPLPDPTRFRRVS